MAHWLPREGAGLDHGVVPGDLLALGPDSRPTRSTLIPASTKVAGMRSEKYFSVSDAPAPGRSRLLRTGFSFLGPLARAAEQSRDRVGDFLLAGPCRAESKTAVGVVPETQLTDGMGARFRCFQNAVIQPPGPRTWMWETS